MRSWVADEIPAAAVTTCDPRHPRWADRPARSRSRTFPAAVSLVGVEHGDIKGAKVLAMLALASAPAGGVTTALAERSSLDGCWWASRVPVDRAQDAGESSGSCRSHARR